MQIYSNESRRISAKIIETEKYYESCIDELEDQHHCKYKEASNNDTTIKNLKYRLEEITSKQ